MFFKAFQDEELTGNESFDGINEIAALESRKKTFDSSVDYNITAAGLFIFKK